MYKVGDVVSRGGVDYVLTENGPVIGERMSWAKNALLGAGAAAKSYGLNAGEVLGLVSSESVKQAEQERQAFDEMSAAQNPGAATAGAIGLELPLGMLGGKGIQAGTGAVTGFLQPTDAGIMGRLGNAAIGAGLSVGGDIAGNMAARVGNAITSAAAPAMSKITGSVGGGAGGGGGGGRRLLDGLMGDAENMGFRLTPGMREGDDALRTLELGFETNPSTMGWYKKIGDDNRALVSTKVGQAAGISPETLAQTGGRITEDALNEALVSTRGVFDDLAQSMTDGVKIGDALLERIGKRVNFKELKDESVGFQKIDDGILTGRDYQELRSWLTEAADKDNLLGSEVAAIGSQIDALDMAVARQLPEDALPAFQRAREQTRVLKSIMRGNAIDGEGFINAKTASHRLRQTFGDESYLTGKYSQSMPNGTVIDYQPETAHALKALRIANHNDMAPFVGSSGTGERAAAASYLSNLLSAAKGDKEAIAQIIGMGKLGDLYQYIGENNPQILRDLIVNDPGAFGSFTRRAGESAGGAGARDWQKGDGEQ